MEHKKTIKKITLFSIFVMVLGVTLAYLGDSLNNFGLYYETAEWIFGTLIFLPFSLLLSCVALFFSQQEIFQSWKKFAKIYLSITVAIILFFTFSGGGGGNFGVGGGMDDPGVITGIFSFLFFLVSIIIIVVKSRKLKK